MINLRVDKIEKESDKRCDKTIDVFDVYQVPDLGELFNVKGNPYRVIERSWSINEFGTLYCYVRVK